MAVWVVRAGRHGEDELLALNEGLSVVAWREVSDISGIASRDQLEQVVRAAYPERSLMQISMSVAQLWAFKERIQVGDLVILPLKSRSALAIGRITGSYRYRPDLPETARHTRSTDWIATDIPRNSVDGDLLQSLGALQTVFQIQRPNAEQRVLKLIGGTPAAVTLPPSSLTEEELPSEQPGFDIEQYAGDQVRNFVGRKFRGHELARLVNELLKAQGYRTRVSPPGPDGGVDILVGTGPLGFDEPRLCVQVKSGDFPVDVGVLRELQGILKNFGAQHGLLVAWGGYKSSVANEARRLFFDIRLWDAGDIVDEIYRNYDRLPPELQAELPLKRIWALVPEE